MSSVIPPINYDLRYSKMSKLLVLHVGYASPLTIPHEENEIFFNFHLDINGYHWNETVEYRFLYDLNTNIIPYSDDEQLNNFPNLTIDEYSSMHKLLRDIDYDEASMKILLATIRSMETWMYTVLTHLHKIDEESRQMCKQLFFRSEEKLTKYEYLYKILKNKELGRDHPNSSVTMDTSFHSINKVFKTMTSLFSLQSHHSGDNVGQPKLSEVNLVKHSKIQEAKRGSITNNTTKPAKKRQSIFARSLGTSSARDKRETNNTLGAIPPKHTALDVAKNTALLKVEVSRGNEALQGVVMYDITLRSTGKRAIASITTTKSNTSSGKSEGGGNSPKGSLIPSNVYKTSQRFSSFKKLWLQLNEVNQRLLTKGNDRSSMSEEVTRGSLTAGPSFQDFIQLIKAPFPALPMKCYLGFSLNESELSQRTRMLDEWFRDVCYNYKNMPAAARLLVRNFLKLDANRATDAFFQDQLAWGVIEINAGRSGPVIVLQQNILDSVPEDVMDEIEAMSQADSKVDATKIAPYIQQQHGGKPDISDSRTERSHRSQTGAGNSELQNLIWETASQGGVSKLPINQAKSSRTVIRR